MRNKIAPDYIVYQDTSLAPQPPYIKLRKSTQPCHVVPAKWIAACCQKGSIIDPSTYSDAVAAGTAALEDLTKPPDGRHPLLKYGKKYFFDLILKEMLAFNWGTMKEFTEYFEKKVSSGVKISFSGVGIWLMVISIPKDQNSTVSCGTTVVSFPINARDMRRERRLKNRK